MDLRKLKFLLIFLLIALFSLFIVYIKVKNDKISERLYRQGSEFYVLQKYSDAYYNFKQINSFSNLYEIALIKQIQCANKLDDKKTQQIKLLELIKKTKDKNILPWALYNETIISAELKTDSNSKQYKKYKYIYETFKDTDFAIASAYRMAKLKEKDSKTLAKDKYIEYLLYAPDGKFSVDAVDSLSRLNIDFSKDELETIAKANLLNKKYAQALELYKQTSFSKNWGNIAKCYRGLKDTQNEKITILKGLDLKTSSIEEKELANLIERLVFVANSNKVQTLQNLYIKYPNSYITPTVTYKLAENTNSIRSYKLYESVSTNYPDSIWASNSLWEIFWYNYLQKRYKTCEMLASKHIFKYSQTQDAPRVLYWYAKVLLKEKKNQKAKETFYKVIANYPLSYYSFLSARALKMSKAKKMIVKKPITAYNINSLNKFLFKDKIILMLAEKNDFKTIDEFKINNEFIKSWIANKKENYPLSINLAKDELYKTNNPEEKTPEEEKEQDLKISFSNWELKLIYPVVFEKEINEYAQMFKLSPYLFMSLIREESHFDKNAKSQAGATGLAQLMGPTANFIEKTDVSKDTLLNPNENIRIGMKYFNYLVNYFNKNEYLAILSYNAGPGNINKWLNDPYIESDEIDVFVENIPYLETKNYIKKILSSYWVYLNIYSPKNKIKTR